MAFVVPPIQSRPAFLPQDVPQTRRQELAGLGTGYGYGSSVFRDPTAVDYYQNLLANTLLSPNGSVVSEDLGNLISPAERFALSQQLGFHPETTTELFTALGLGQPDPITGETAPITREAIGNALRNLPLNIRNEGGDRQGAHPGRGDVTGIGAIAAPGFNEAMLGSQIGPAAALALGAPALAPAAAIGGLGLVGSSLAGALQSLTGRPGVLGPNRPAPLSMDFDRTVAMGKAGPTQAREMGFLGRARSSGRGGDMAGPGGAGQIGREAGIGGASVGRAHDFGRAQHDREGGGNAGGSGGGPAGGGSQGGTGGAGAADRCFVAGTLILMADGTRKPIEKIKIGDKVMSFVNKGPLEKDSVYATFEHDESEIYNLNGVLTTAEHPFLTEMGFRKVEELYFGQKLVTENGELFPVETLEKLPQKQRVYNIGVAKNQTYIADGYRVHNKRAYGGMVTPDLDIKRHFADGGQIGMIDPSMMGPPMQGDPTFMPNPQNGAGPDDLSITAQTGEYVVSKPAVQMFGPEFFDVLNDLAMKNPDLDPKSVLKAASAVIPKPEAETKAQPGDLGSRIGAAIGGQGNFASGGLIGTKPVRL